MVPDGERVAVSRVHRTPEDARRAYNRLSRWYDALANASEGPLRDRGLAVLGARPGDRVLEIGFGTGHGLLRLAECVGASGFVAGVDISDGMAALAGRRLVEAGQGGPILVTVADGPYLPYGAAGFDAVFMSFTLELFDTPRLPEVLASCRRVLRPGGRLVVVALVSDGDDAGVAVKLYEMAHRRLPRWVDCRPIPLRRLLAAHGFCIARAERQAMWGLPVDIVSAQGQEDA